MNRKGIILAGGTGSRLYPVTAGVSKQLLPVYDKPMIYYPLSTLMLAGIRDILIITTPHDQASFMRLLGDGGTWGISIKYAIQDYPAGLAQAFLIGSDFINGDPVALILGDNLFYGTDLRSQLVKAAHHKYSTIFGYLVSDPQRYGVIEFDKNQNIKDIVEKPISPKSKYAVTGLYFYDSSIVEKAKEVLPSKRGELEITDINKMYLEENNLDLILFNRGTAWLDTGTIDSLHDASSFIRTIELRQGLKVGCPEEVSWRKGWINSQELESSAKNLIKSGYGKYLLNLLSLEKIQLFDLL